MERTWSSNETTAILPAPLFKMYVPLRPRMPPKEVVGPANLSTSLVYATSFSFALGVAAAVVAATNARFFLMGLLRCLL